MHQHQFTQFLKNFDLLDLAQIEEARTRISNVRKRKEVRVPIEGRGARECPLCGSDRRHKWGKPRMKVQRCRCGSFKKRPSVDALAQGVRAFISHAMGIAVRCFRFGSQLP